MGIIVVTVRYAERVRRRAATRDPAGAHQLLLLEFGMLAYLVAGIWGSYAKLNMLYLHLVLLWCTAKALEAESVGGAPPPTTGR
jgi:hypothetical protein